MLLLVARNLPSNHFIKLKLEKNSKKFNTVYEKTDDKGNLLYFCDQFQRSLLYNSECDRKLQILDQSTNQTYYDFYLTKGQHLPVDKEDGHIMLDLNKQQNLSLPEKN